MPTVRLGIPKESTEGERRVAATPESVKKLKDQGFAVFVEASAGGGAGIPDEAYLQAGAEIVSAAQIWGDSDVVIKVRSPSLDEVAVLRRGTLVVSILQPERFETISTELANRGASALALERVPRVTRAQKMDVLSSMGNLTGYRAVVEATQAFEGFFSPQVTAAGSLPPARVLVIGAGVAGLAALGAARSLGADVRAFDTRAAAREQVESLGGKFLQVTVTEDGDGGGGYAKEMSPAFIEAEMALFRAQAAEVDIIITTALIPGKTAPVLLPEDVVSHLRPGSVVVDLAAEQGGNCAWTVPGKIVQKNGVTVIGWTDFPSRMASTASRLFANNMVHLMAEMGGGNAFRIDLENDVIRPALVVHQGEVLPRPPPKAPSPTVVVAPSGPTSVRTSLRPKSLAPLPSAKPVQMSIRSPTRRAWGSTLGGMFLVGALFFIGRFAPIDFLQHSTVFVLACFVGWQVIWSVTAALHTPLMSVTNAISGIIIIGGMLQVTSELNGATILGALAALFAAINIAGGFLVTERMLRMFRKGQ
jgi:NAD(P) transhydrogenase subunit alpha